MGVTELATLIAACATLIAAITNTIIAWRTRSAVHEVHLSTNSRLDELLASTRTEAHAAGVKEGRDETP